MTTATDTKEAQEIIDKILSANKIEDLINTNNFKSEFDSLIKKIHPDICSLSKAGDATAKLNELKDKFKNGTKFTDDAGDFITNGYNVEFSGDKSLLDKSLSNYNILKSLKGDTALHFQKYIPVSASLNGGKLSFKMDKRAVPLSGLELPQEHVNWILSRALEFTAWLHGVGYVHCGITPESIFVIPENHGIQICSFYHMKPVGGRVTTISAKYKNWYPPNLFSSKEATPNVDIELCKKTAICLLGDKSGSGIKLKKTHNEKFMDFVIAQHYDSYDTFSQYRKLLTDNFEKKFYHLDL